MFKKEKSKNADWMQKREEIKRDQGRDVQLEQYVAKRKYKTMFMTAWWLAGAYIPICLTTFLFAGFAESANEIYFHGFAEVFTFSIVGGIFCGAIPRFIAGKYYMHPDSVIERKAEDIKNGDEKIMETIIGEGETFVRGGKLIDGPPKSLAAIAEKCGREASSAVVKYFTAISPWKLKNRIFGDVLPATIMAEGPFPYKYENRGTFFIGSAGSGKTQAIKEFIYGVFKRGGRDRIVFYDRKPEYVTMFYKKGDVILCPADMRHTRWDLFQEIEGEQDLDSVINSLIPEASRTEDLFWVSNSRNLLKAILVFLLTEQENNHAAWKLRERDPDLSYDLNNSKYDLDEEGNKKRTRKDKAFIDGTQKYIYLFDYDKDDPDTYLMYEVINAKGIYEKYKEKYDDKEHPKTYLTSDEIDELTKSKLIKECMEKDKDGNKNHVRGHLDVGALYVVENNMKIYVKDDMGNHIFAWRRAFIDDNKKFVYYFDNNDDKAESYLKYKVVDVFGLDSFLSEYAKNEKKPKTFLTPEDIKTLTGKGVIENCRTAGVKEVEDIRGCLDRDSKYPKPSNRDLVLFMAAKMSSPSDLWKEMQRYENSKFYASGIAGADKSQSATVTNIIASLTSYTASFTRPEVAERGTFSIKEWLHNPETEGTSIFLSNPAKYGNNYESYFTLIMNLALAEAISLDTDLNRRLWFVIDEFGSLQKLGSVIRLLAEGRSKGACVVIGTQDIAQIEQKYDKLHTTLINNCNNQCIARVTDYKEAEYLSKMYGEIEVETDTADDSIQIGKEVTFSMSEHKKAKERKTRPVVMPTEVSNLPDLTYIVRVADVARYIQHIEYYPWSKHDIIPAFIAKSPDYFDTRRVINGNKYIKKAKPEDSGGSNSNYRKGKYGSFSGY